MQKIVSTPRSTSKAATTSAPVVLIESDIYPQIFGIQASRLMNLILDTQTNQLILLWRASKK